MHNVVQANLLAATTQRANALNQVYNIAVQARTTLNELFRLLRDDLARLDPGLAPPQPIYGEFRAGDVRHSLADISKAKKLLGHEPSHTLQQGLTEAIEWYCRTLGPPRKRPSVAPAAALGSISVLPRPQAASH